MTKLTLDASLYLKGIPVTYYAFEVKKYKNAPICQGYFFILRVFLHFYCLKNNKRTKRPPPPTMPNFYIKGQNSNFTIRNASESSATPNNIVLTPFPFSLYQIGGSRYTVGLSIFIIQLEQTSNQSKLNKIIKQNSPTNLILKGEIKK